jgi:hypothetical protein
MPIEAQPGIVREHVERDRTAVARQLASIVRYPRERLTEFTRSLLESVERI